MSDGTGHEQFRDLSTWQRRGELARHLNEVEFNARKGTFGPVIFQLRARARRFETQARWSLFGLMAVILSGLLLYFLPPIATEIVQLTSWESKRRFERESFSLDRQHNELRDEILDRLAWVPVRQRLPGYSAAFNDAQFGPQGEAVIVGMGGTILTRAADATDWELHGVEGVSAELIDVQIGQQGDVVAIGWGGTILMRASGATDWVQPHILIRDDSDHDFKDVRFGPHGEAVIVGYDRNSRDGNLSKILTRAPGATDWVPQYVGDVGALYEVRFGLQGEAVTFGYKKNEKNEISSTVLARAPGTTVWVPQYVGDDGALYEVRFGPHGEAVIVGEQGKILTRAADATDWELHGVEGVSIDLNDVQFGPQGEAVIVGDQGTILTRAPRATDWELSKVGVSVSLHRVWIGSDGEAVIVGRDRTILTRASGATDWLQPPVDWLRPPVDGISDNLLDVQIGPRGEAVIVGEGSTILTRAPGATDWVQRPVEGDSSWLTDVRFGPQGDLVIIGRGNTVIELTHEFAVGKNSAKSEKALRAVYDELPGHLKDPLEEQRLKDIASRREEVRKAFEEETERTASINQEAQLRRQRVLDLTDFMDGCVSSEGGANEIRACAAALDRAAIWDVGLRWWELLDEPVARIVLLFFLLATLNTLYRYNLRMAAFYNGRADALELSEDDVMYRQSFGELAETLAADAVEFRAGKMPVENVTEIAKSVISRMDPKKGG